MTGQPRSATLPRMGETLDCLVIGAGVVGLAVARALARSGREVVIAEAEDRFGTVTSARNSEVIHAGIYYPTHSLKAQFCVRGRQDLYDFCARFGVEARKVTKLIVATSEAEVETLHALKNQAAQNGVPLTWLEATAAQALEPNLACSAALLSPETGIVDSHALMTALLGDAESHGAKVAYRTPVTHGEPVPGGIKLTLSGAEETSVTCRHVVNCAGLSAQTITAAMAGARAGPTLRLAKGNYFSLTGRVPFQRLIYPVPQEGGVGVHFTLDLAGRGRFGPDVEWIDDLDYTVDPARGGAFYSTIRRYWPGLPDGALQPAYAGIRPKIDMKNGQASDFMIQFDDETDCPGYVALYGIESPGLTCCLAIADYVAERLT